MSSHVLPSRRIELMDEKRYYAVCVVFHPFCQSESLVISLRNVSCFTDGPFKNVHRCADHAPPCPTASTSTCCRTPDKSNTSVAHSASRVGPEPAGTQRDDPNLAGSSDTSAGRKESKRKPPRPRRRPAPPPPRESVPRETERIYPLHQPPPRSSWLHRTRTAERLKKQLIYSVIQ